MPKLNVTTPVKPSAKPAPAKPSKPQIKAAAKPKQSGADKAEQRQALAKLIASERATAATLFAALDNASVSIPVKSLKAFNRSYKRDVTAHAIGRKPSMRQASALAVACLANGKTIKNGAKFSRKFERAGASYAIENGALSDALASGLCAYDSASETITIKSAPEIASLIGTVTSLAI